MGAHHCITPEISPQRCICGTRLHSTHRAGAAACKWYRQSADTDNTSHCLPATFLYAHSCHSGAGDGRGGQKVMGGRAVGAHTSFYTVSPDCVYAMLQHNSLRYSAINVAAQRCVYTELLPRRCHLWHALSFRPSTPSCGEQVLATRRAYRSRWWMPLARCAHDVNTLSIVSLPAPPSIVSLPRPPTNVSLPAAPPR